MNLLEVATKARQNAHAPYSKFKVGAAIRSASGVIYAGCNVENAAYPEGTCAEAGAISAMVAAGETEITEVLIIAKADVPITPCGGCRQRLKEFAASDVIVRMVTLSGAQSEMTMGELLPGAFDHTSIQT